ncbi:MAG TPA: thioesterase family protein [Acidisarcina sp.]|nr:thioesterase family protein [Acidisarcina sp.]
MAHINSFVRIPLLGIRQYLRPLPRIGVLDEDLVRMRVWPNDIDLNFHLNNSRFLSCMDYGRMHLTAATGVLQQAVAQRWQPLVGSVFVTYRRSLPLFTPFHLSSRILCWDERWFYMEQSFRFREGLAAVAWVKALFRARNVNVAPQAIVDAVSSGQASPPMPDSLAQWNALTRDKLQSQ